MFAEHTSISVQDMALNVKTSHTGTHRRLLLHRYELGSASLFSNSVHGLRINH